MRRALGVGSVIVFVAASVLSSRAPRRQYPIRREDAPLGEIALFVKQGSPLPQDKELQEATR